MVYDSYWSPKADSTAIAKRRCVWVTEETNRRDSSWKANSADSSEGHENLGYEVGPERSAEEQEKSREEEERIWLEWQSVDFDVEHRQSHSEIVADNSILIEPSAPSAPRRSRKRSLAINTDGIVKDVALNSAGQELNWDPLLPYGYPLSPNACIGTGSFVWEKALFGQTPEEDEVQNGEKWEESEISTGVLENIIDPQLLAMG